MTLRIPFASALLLSLSILHAADPPPTTHPAAFELREVSALDLSSPATNLLRGQYERCTTQPSAQVKYPKLNSPRPFYGSITFDRSVDDPKTGLVFHFVIDESRPSTPPRYDRLYLDSNRDLDLRNDSPVGLMKDVPPLLREASQQVFDYLDVPFDYGATLGVRPFRVMPRLTVSGDNAYLFFASPIARRGTIQIGSRQYGALLAQPYLITARFDRPHTLLQLTPLNRRPSTSGPADDSLFPAWGMDSLGAFREVDGQYYTLSATPLGDKLFVAPYRGQFGIVALGPGQRDIKDLSFTGSLTSRDHTVAIGPTPIQRDKPLREYRIPVGDYYPREMSVQFGRLRMFITDNYHSDGHPREHPQPKVFGIKVRADKPFILDFSNKPQVLFASPAKSQTFRPGDEVKIAAVLVDPDQDFMIRNLNDTTRKEKETFKTADGQEHSYDRDVSLDPVVTITNSSGKTVFTGKMPFG